MGGVCTIQFVDQSGILKWNKEGKMQSFLEVLFCPPFFLPSHRLRALEECLPSPVVSTPGPLGSPGRGY